MSEEGDEVQHKASCHSPGEWNLQRANFTQLYFGEDRPLRQVQKLMEERHGFYATARQYKRKILHWGLDKNVKESDMKYVLQKQLKRKLEEGKDTESTVNGRLVPPQKMQRFAQRKGISNDDILMYQADSPPYISTYTPRGPSSAMHSSADDDGYSSAALVRSGDSALNSWNAEDTLSDKFLVDHLIQPMTFELEMSSPKPIIIEQETPRAPIAKAREIFPVPEPIPPSAYGKLETLDMDVAILQLEDSTSLPFERRSSRYYLSDSPDYYAREIRPSNPLYHLSPLSVDSPVPSSPYTRLGQRRRPPTSNMIIQQLKASTSAADIVERGFATKTCGAQAAKGSRTMDRIWEKWSASNHTLQLQSSYREWRYM